MSSRSFSRARKSFRAASSRALAVSTVFFASATPAWMASICLGRRAASASRPEIFVSNSWRWTRVLGSLTGIRLQWWAHLDSNQEPTGYEPAALPLSYGPVGSQVHERTSRLEEAPQFLGARWMAQLPQRLGLDLPDAFAGDCEVLADLLQGVLAAVGEAEAQAQYLLLAGRQRVQDLVGLLAQGEADDRLHRRHHLLVLDEIAQVAVLFLPDGRLQRDRLLGDLEDLADLVHRHVHLLGDLLRRGLAAQLLDELAGGAVQLVVRLDHVDGNPDRARLVGDGSGNCLPDPPGGVGRKLVAAPLLELVHGLHQADVAFLDEVQELQAPVRVLLGDRDDQP